MKIIRADNYQMARDLAGVYAKNDYAIYTDNRSAVLCYEEDKPHGGEMILITGSMEVSIVILSEIARVILGKENS